MDNRELAAMYQGKADGIKVVYGEMPPNTYGTCYKLSAEDRLAFAYIRDVGDLCNVIEVIPDNASELEAAHAEALYWKKMFCRCGCEEPDVDILTDGFRCKVCGEEFTHSQAKKKTQ